MAHIHELIDLTVSAYIFYGDKILLIHHKKLNKWLQIGGHVELHEDTDEALLREIDEECGLPVRVLAEGHDVVVAPAKPLWTPHFVNIHSYNKTHRHLDLGYVCKADHPNVRLAEGEHRDIQWFTREELKSLDVFENVRYYCDHAFDVYAKCTSTV